MRIPMSIAALWVAAILAASGCGLGAEEKPAVTACLLADVSAVVPGQSFLIGVHLTMVEGWHVYWKNPGEAGLATEVAWQLPEGFTAGPLLWPVPIRFTMPGSITSFGYADEVMLLAQVTAPTGLKAGDAVEFAAKVSWLGCKDRCVPGEATVRLTLPVADEREAANGGIFHTWRDRLPRAPGDREYRVKVSVEPSDSEQAGATYRVTLLWPGPVTDVEWFPDPGPAVELADVKTSVQENRATITFTASVLKGLRLERHTMESVVAYTDTGGRRRGVLLAVPIATQKEPEPPDPEGVRPDKEP